MKGGVALERKRDCFCDLGSNFLTTKAGQQEQESSHDHQSRMMRRNEGAGDERMRRHRVLSVAQQNGNQALPQPGAARPFPSFITSSWHALKLRSTGAVCDAQDLRLQFRPGGLPALSCTLQHSPHTAHNLISFCMVAHPFLLFFVSVCVRGREVTRDGERMCV